MVLADCVLHHKGPHQLEDSILCLRDARVCIKTEKNWRENFCSLVKFSVDRHYFSGLSSDYIIALWYPLDLRDENSMIKPIVIL